MISCIPRYWLYSLLYWGPNIKLCFFDPFRYAWFGGSWISWMAQWLRFTGMLSFAPMPCVPASLHDMAKMRVGTGQSRT